MIPVTKPFLPPKAEYDKFVEGIWSRNWLTNNGPLVNELELKLKEYLGLPNLLYVSNGTIALQLAIKALGLKGEIITTPFSYIATTSSIVWEGCMPVFTDIDPLSLNIDPAKIEAAISSKTSAILATHVYGNPCDIDAIQKIADRHKLKVIYDAAHCFGTIYKGRSIFAFGDICTASFHATKIFQTIEGGAVFSSNPDILETMRYMRNFGHDGPGRFAGVGINGKNSEFHAAMGLVNLKYIDEILLKAKSNYFYYKSELEIQDLSFIEDNPNAKPNYSYFPILLESEKACIKCFEGLQRKKVFARRYFYPSLDTLDYLIDTGKTNSVELAKRVLCLPMYFQLNKVEQDLVIQTIKMSFKGGLS